MHIFMFDGARYGTLYCVFMLEKFCNNEVQSVGICDCVVMAVSNGVEYLVKSKHLSDVYADACGTLCPRAPLCFLFSVFALPPS